ncbi:DMT family transporter [Rubellimicrobium roseum]|uniref:DMT family transporter n=1 Tax=Rubellimicrobium roseum TaxID=687525 RepID=A0A5C4NCA1_9RHOB|nr:DMT family transporter [Rubellimicrobium roseum]TNC71500.1 DMT family transporter [Rubellimicrobium roseum]
MAVAEEVTVWTGLPVLAGALYGLGNLVTRKWCAEEGTLTLLGGFFALMMVWGTLGCLVLWFLPRSVPEGAAGWATRGWVAPQGVFLVITVVQGVGSLVGVGMSIKAYQIANATVVSVLENTLLVFATLWAVVLWREVPGPTEALRLGLVTAAGVMIALREPRAAGPVPEEARPAPSAGTQAAWAGEKRP